MKQWSKSLIINRIAFVGNYLPRKCGIATFTTDLCEAISEVYSDKTCFVLPVNDIEVGYAYPSKVRFELKEKDINSYSSAADFLNINDVDIVCLQFEFGIFGGKAGSHIITLLNGLRMPVVTTLHTVLDKPDVHQKAVFEEVAALSDRLIVMSEMGVEILQRVYNISPNKIDVIPHGIPDLSFVDPSFNKDLFGVEGKTVLLSFGLLSPNKGIESVISAMPKILERFPESVYIVVGVTHPNIIKNEGETYRISLQWLSEKNNVESSVIFYNRFVSMNELIEFISIADIYITPYLTESQITSGTLAYTVGAGKAIISTPYWYAKEILSEGRGVLVPFKDSDALAAEVIKLLENEPGRQAMRKRAYMYGRTMIWSEVAKKYMKSFEVARVDRSQFNPGNLEYTGHSILYGTLPTLKLDQLYNLTDCTGIFQHALYSVPNFSHGYTTDDNARAIIVSVLYNELGITDPLQLTSKYLAFLAFAFNEKNNKFRNFMSYSRNWLEEQGSDDSNGRALMALGTLLNHSSNQDYNSLAAWLFEQTLSSILDTTSPRAWAFTLLGLYEYYNKYSGDSRANNVRDILAGRLLELYKNNSSEEWCWFEDQLSYSNATLSHSLLSTGKITNNNEMIDAGLKSLLWLVKLQKSETGFFLPVGSNGFYSKGGERARFDQQPTEAQVTVSACLIAYKITHDKFWAKEANRAFEWFLGRNYLSTSVYDPATGGCRDGLHSDRLNQNQGAESTLAFLHSLLELKIQEQLTIIEKVILI